MFDEIQLKRALDEIHYKLDGLPNDLRAKGMRFAARKAANLIRDAAIANAQRIDNPLTPEEIAKNIVVRFSSRRFKKTGDVMFRVGVMGGAAKYADDRWNRAKGRAGKTYQTLGSKKNPGGDTWYWRFIEFGTEHNRATPTLRPALENNLDAAVAETAKHLGKWLDRYARKKQKERR